MIKLNFLINLFKNTGFLKLYAAYKSLNISVRKNRKIGSFAKILVLTAFILAVCLSCAKEGKEGIKIKIGVSLYQGEDTFVTSLKEQIVKFAKETEEAENIKITMNIQDAGGKQATQNDQVDAFISQGYDIICVNMVDRTAAAVIIDKAKEADIPIIFFNREPVAEDMDRWDKLFYVGSKAEQSGKIQGELIAELFTKTPEAVDKNSDGILQYVILEGELGHQDALLRTEYSIRELSVRGVKAEKLANDSAAWRRSLAKERMSAWLNTYGDRIEVVFANNDEMALGAIDAAADAGYTFLRGSNIIVVGVDATEAGVESIKKGQMYATVLNDTKKQGKAIFDIAYSMVTEGDAKTNIDGFDGKYVLTNYVPFTLENVYDMK